MARRKASAGPVPFGQHKKEGSLKELLINK